MDFQESKIISAVTFFFLSAIAGFLIFLSNTGLCWNPNCTHEYANTIAYPMLYAFVPVLVASLLMFFASDRAYRLWRKLSIIFIPVFAVLAYFAPLACELGDCFSKNKVAKTAGLVFFIISIALVFLFRNRKVPEINNE